MAIRKAVRERAPLLVQISGKSGSGKTLSSLLFAAGLAGDGGTVGFLDTENRRGGLYADNPRVVSALPNGYLIDDIYEPFSPARFSEKINAFESAGCNVLIIDSISHEWEGYGGCQDIAEQNKLRGNPNWAKAKREHKSLINTILSSGMDCILCTRAQEKVRVEMVGGKVEYFDAGLQPCQEKNFGYEMILSMMLDADTHIPKVTKCPEPLLHIFGGERSSPLCHDDGLRLKEWAMSGKIAEVDIDELLSQAISYAELGTRELEGFWSTLSSNQKKALKPRLDEAKKIAMIADDNFLQEEDSPLL